jgi:hypothetical protein
MIINEHIWESEITYIHIILLAQLLVPVVSDINYVAITFSGSVSMHESEVQPLIAFNSSRLEIISFFLGR